MASSSSSSSSSSLPLVLSFFTFMFLFTASTGETHRVSILDLDDRSDSYECRCTNELGEEVFEPTTLTYLSKEKWEARVSGFFRRPQPIHNCVIHRSYRSFFLVPMRTTSHFIAFSEKMKNQFCLPPQETDGDCRWVFKRTGLFVVNMTDKADVLIKLWT